MKVKSLMTFGALIVVAVLTVVAFSVKLHAEVTPRNLAQNNTFRYTVNRYALLAGSFCIDNADGKREQLNGIFKLDTYSGKTWMLKIITENGSSIEKWVLIDQ